MSARRPRPYAATRDVWTLQEAIDVNVTAATALRRTERRAEVGKETVKRISYVLSKIASGEGPPIGEAFFPFANGLCISNNSLLS